MFELPGDSLVLRADVFNVFDFQSEQDFNEFGDRTGPADPDPNYGRVTGYQAPRSVRLSVAYRF